MEICTFVGVTATLLCSLFGDAEPREEKVFWQTTGVSCGSASGSCNAPAAFQRFAAFQAFPVGRETVQGEEHAILVDTAGNVVDTTAFAETYVGPAMVPGLVEVGACGLEMRFLHDQGTGELVTSVPGEGVWTGIAGSGNLLILHMAEGSSFPDPTRGGACTPNMDTPDIPQYVDKGLLWPIN